MNLPVYNGKFYFFFSSFFTDHFKTKISVANVMTVYFLSQLQRWMGMVSSARQWVGTLIYPTVTENRFRVFDWSFKKWLHFPEKISDDPCLKSSDRIYIDVPAAQEISAKMALYMIFLSRRQIINFQKKQQIWRNKVINQIYETNFVTGEIPPSKSYHAGHLFQMADRFPVYGIT